jgi:hypothetical protein
MPSAAPIRIEIKEARNAAVELILSSLRQGLHVIPDLVLRTIPEKRPFHIGGNGPDCCGAAD